MSINNANESEPDQGTIESSDVQMPSTCKQRCCAALKDSCTSPHVVIRELVKEFGWQFMIMLMCAYLLVKGSLYTFISTGMLPYFQAINVTGTSYQRYKIAAFTPWSMKALFGALSDATPLCGYYKSVYIILSSVSGVAAFVTLSTVDLTADQAPIAAVLFFLGCLQLAVCDLLCEGRYAALMVEKPHTGASIVTWVWMCYQVGSLLSASVIGPLSDAGAVNVIFMVCIPLAAQIVIPVALGFLGENPLTRQQMILDEEKTARLMLEDSEDVIQAQHTDADQDWADKNKMDVYCSFNAGNVATNDAVTSPAAAPYGAIETPRDDSDDGVADDDAGDVHADVSLPKDPCCSGKNQIVPLCCRDAYTGIRAPATSVIAASTSIASSETGARTSKSFDKYRMSRPPCCSVRCAKIRAQPQLFALAILMAAGSFALSIISLLDNDVLQLAYSLSISALLCGLGFLWLPTVLAKVNLYMFLQDVLYVQIYGAIDYFYTAGPECVPDGPHFDYTFYASWSGIVGSLAGWLGVILFQVVMGNWTFRQVFWVTTIIRVCASLVDVVIIERWNKLIHVDDKLMYMLGDNIIYALCYMMNFMPAVVLTSKVCPKNMEATIYALLAGFQNFGQSVAASIGIYVIKAFNIQTNAEGGGCDFKNLSIMVVVCHFALPLLAIPLTFVLIPNARLTEEVEVENEVQVGSNVWCGRCGTCCRGRPASPGAAPRGGGNRRAHRSVFDNNHTRRAVLLKPSRTI